MKIRIAVICIAMLFAISLSSAFTFHGDVERTGFFNATGSKAPGILWTVDLTGLVDSSPVYVNNTIYVQNWYGLVPWNPGLYAINASTGQIIWKNSAITGASTPAVYNGRIYIGTLAGDLYAVDTTNGQVIWKKNLETNPKWHGIASSPLIYNGTLYVTTFSDGTLHVLDLSGNELWNVTTGGEISHYTSPAAYNGMIFFAGNSSGVNALYSVNETGSILWTFTVNGKILDTPSTGYGKVFFATSTRLYAVDLNGNEVWSIPFNGTISTPAIAYGNIYVGSSDGKLYSINASTGNAVWSFTANGKIDSSPAVADGVVYFGTNTGNGTVYALSAITGSEIWRYSLNPPSGSYYNIMSSPFIAGNRVFIGTDSGKVYCFTPIIWNGTVDINPAEVNIKLKDGSTASVSGSSVLSALVKASQIGKFNVTVSSSSWGLYVESINDVYPQGWVGWMYTVNGVSPPVGVADYNLNSGDVVEFYYGNWGVKPENAEYRVIITANLTNIIWNDSVNLKMGNFSVTAKSGKNYSVNNITALGALNLASKTGNFNYTVDDSWYTSYNLLMVDSIAGISNNGTSGWMYWVNYPTDPMPMTGANNFTVKDGDVVYWYYSQSMNDTPSNSIAVIKIRVSTEKATIENFNVSSAQRGGYATAWVNATASTAGWYVIVVSGTNSAGEPLAGIGTVYIKSGEKVRVPVLIPIPLQAKTGKYELYAGIYALDTYPDSVLKIVGPQDCEVT